MRPEGALMVELSYNHGGHNMSIGILMRLAVKPFRASDSK